MFSAYCKPSDNGIVILETVNSLITMPATIDLGKDDFWSARYFFLAAWCAGYFFPPKCSAGYFFLSSFLCRIFFPQKSVVFTFTECIYIYIVVIAVIVLIWSCKALKCCKLYKIILVSLHVFGMSFFRII